jgi:hypothetical protein
VEFSCKVSLPIHHISYSQTKRAESSDLQHVNTAVCLNLHSINMREVYVWAVSDARRNMYRSGSAPVQDGARL